METKKIVCSSCHTAITNKAGAVHMACPSCGKGSMARCPSCRKIGAKYVCAECHFEGP